METSFAHNFENIFEIAATPIFFGSIMTMSSLLTLTVVSHCNLLVSAMPFFLLFTFFLLPDIMNVTLISESLWQYGLLSFQMGGTKLERFLPKNRHTQRKLLNFENWVNGEVLKIGHHFSKESDLKIDAIKKCQ